MTELTEADARAARLNRGGTVAVDLAWTREELLRVRESELIQARYWLLELGMTTTKEQFIRSAILHQIDDALRVTARPALPSIERVRGHLHRAQIAESTLDHRHRPLADTAGNPISLRGHTAEAIRLTHV